LTLDEVVWQCASTRLLAAARQSGASFSATRSLSKKACARRSKSARMWCGRAGAGCGNRACLILRIGSTSAVRRWTSREGAENLQGHPIKDWQAFLLTACDSAVSDIKHLPMA